MSRNYGVPNEPEANSNLEVALCLVAAGAENMSPIDQFDQTQKALIIRAGKTRVINSAGDNYIDSDPELIRLLLLGLVSTTENYFRQMLSRILMVCAESQRICASAEVKFSSARYHQHLHITSSLLDESIFSSSEKIESETKRLTGISLSNFSSVKVALAEYHKACILRHAIVHSQGNIGAKNIVDLNVKADCKLAVSLSVSTFERVAEICVNLVRSYNSHMWRAVISRLTEKGWLQFDGTDADKTLFRDCVLAFWAASRLERGQDGWGLYERLQSPN